MPARRVLIAGLSNFWGTRLAAALAADPQTERVVAVDDRPPPDGVPDGVLFVEGDVRSPDLARLMRAAAPDTVVHNALVQFPGLGRSSRTVHDLNVVGTLQLLTACDGLGTLRALVVRGSAAIYGSSAGDPGFFTEDMAARAPDTTRFQRDLAELEAYVSSFARRHPAVTCTVLRMQPVVGPTLDNPVTRFFRLPVVPTVLGFDPRLQLLHEEDSVTALAAAVRTPLAGAVNVAPEGTVSMARALVRARRVALPIPAPLYATVAGALARPAGVRFSDDMLAYLRYGRGVDVRRLTGELGVRPRPTEEALRP